ncbi:MAG: ATP-dependent 6-phosphofructokinase [Planctomycetota bacterium]|nr:ATP-dependent 6-phosphofructokinase [Planctomycetota bacterium]
MKRIGVLTGGGDAPGLNAVIRAVVIRLSKEKGEQYQCIGFHDGWAGLRDKSTVDLTPEFVGSILHEGGTILGTSRTNLYKKPEDVEKALKSYKDLNLDALVAIGGDDTLEIAYYLHRDHHIPAIGVPKTIDNDVLGTDFTFGFWSAVEKAMYAIDDLRTTTMSHHRIMVVECMGRHAGWITAYTGLASEADFIAVPERAVHIDEIAKVCSRAREQGKLHAIVVVAEGASIGGVEPKPRVVRKSDGGWEISEKIERDSFGNVVLKPGEIAEAVARELEKLLKVEVRGLALGHLQRGGSPSAFDRILGTRYGICAAEAVVGCKFGHLVTLRGHLVDTVPMKGMIRENQTEKKRYKLLPKEFLEIAECFYA